MRRPLRLQLAALALLALLAAGACGPSEPEVPPLRSQGQRPNVILILVDTLRADHLSSYGYPRQTSPNLDAFAARNLLFTRATSQAGCTYPSANSLLTSRYPTRFLAQEGGFMGIPEGVTALPEILQAAGYRTMAVSASPIVRNTPSKQNPHGGFGRGFEVFNETCLWRHARCVNREAFRLLNKTTEPFFLYLHYMEPHGPYHPPEELHQNRFARPYDGLDFIAKGDPNPIARMLYSKGPKVEVTPRDLEHLVDLYDEEIAFFDQELQRLLDRLRAQNRLAETLVVITSDHGEEFLEHGNIKHCRSAYQSLVGTPLILKLPASLTAGNALAGGRRLDLLAQNLDIVPTVVDLLGLAPPGSSFEGRSLAPALSELAADHPVSAPPALSYSAQSVYRAVRDERYKLIFSLRKHQVELFDLQADPGETQNVEKQHPEVVRRLWRELRAWMATVEGDGEKSVGAADETEKQLKALGYLQ